MQKGTIQADVQASAGSSFVWDSASGSPAVDAYNKDLDVYCEEFNPGTGKDLTAGSTAGVSWVNDPISVQQTVRAEIYGSGVSDGVPINAYTTTSSSLELYFSVNSNVDASLHFTDNSKKGKSTAVEKMEGGAWVLFAASSGGTWTGTMLAGDYRWVASDSGGTHGLGSDSYYHSFRLQQEGVPEPSSLLALGFAGVLLRRRKR
ncbi:MAG: PEP-CTERM sorting domain-containing protein [Fimbriimonas sp.]